MAAVPAANQPDALLLELHRRTKQLSKDFKKVRQPWKDRDGYLSAAGAFASGVLSYPAIQSLTADSKIQTIVGSVSVAAVVGLGSWLFKRALSSVQENRLTANNAANKCKSLASRIEIYYWSHDHPVGAALAEYNTFRGEFEEIKYQYGGLLPPGEAGIAGNQGNLHYEDNELAEVQKRNNNSHRLSGLALLTRVREASEEIAGNYGAHATEYDRHEKIAAFMLVVFTFIGGNVIAGSAAMSPPAIAAGALVAGLIGAILLTKTGAAWRSKIYAEGQTQAHNIARQATVGGPLYGPNSDDVARENAVRLQGELQDVIDETNRKWDNSYSRAVAAN